MSTTPEPRDLAYDCRRVAEGLLTLADLCISRTENKLEVQYETPAHEVGPLIEILGQELTRRLDTLDRALAA